MTNIPTQEVIDAIEAGITRVTRRVEFYEPDGVTPWYPNGSEEDKFRLSGGSVGIDSARDERRSLDITLNNKDNLLRPNADGGFWYDKILKPYRGVRYATSKRPPSILIIEDSQGIAGAQALRAMLTTLGFVDVAIKLDADELSDLVGYKVILSASRGAAPTKASLLNLAYTAGYSIITWEFGPDGTESYGFGNTAFTYTSAAGQIAITPLSVDSPVAGGWTTENEGAAPVGVTAHGLTAPLTPGVMGVATSLTGTTVQYTAALKASGNSKWFTYRAPGIGTEAKKLWKKALTWVWNYTPYREWETSLGEFYIDTIRHANFPGVVTASARDATKVCLKSKVERNMAWDTGTSTNELIRALGANAGIKKFKLDPMYDVPLSKRIDVARGTERWNIMRDAAAYNNCQLYFDTDGFLVAEPYADPTLGSPFIGFAVNKNLSKYDRSTSDARIYNHIIVTGTSNPGDSEETPIEYFGEYINDNPLSPSSTVRLGDRSYFYTSSFFTSDEQCQTYAETLGGQTAFEQYEIGWTSLVYPHLDGGKVVDFQDPDAIQSDPTRFLMDTLEIPLGLGGMTASGKRVLFVEALEAEEQETA